MTDLWACWAKSIDPGNRYDFPGDSAEQAAEACAKAMGIGSGTPTEIWVAPVFGSGRADFKSCRLGTPRRLTVTLHGAAGERVEVSS